jgi:hypothetical protein
MFEVERINRKKIVTRIILHPKSPPNPRRPALTAPTVGLALYPLDLSPIFFQAVRRKPPGFYHPLPEASQPTARVTQKSPACPKST